VGTIRLHKLDDFGEAVVGEYVITPVLASAAGSLDLTTAEGWDRATSVITAGMPTGDVTFGDPLVATTDAGGFAEVTDVPVGLYYITDATSTPPSEAFMLTVPVPDPVGGESALFTIDAYPKVMRDVSVDAPLSPADPGLLTTGDNDDPGATLADTGFLAQTLESLGMTRGQAMAIGSEILIFTVGLIGLLHSRAKRARLRAQRATVRANNPDNKA
jgi:hypothetical protein